MRRGALNPHSRHGRAVHADGRRLGRVAQGCRAERRHAHSAAGSQRAERPLKIAKAGFVHRMRPPQVRIARPAGQLLIVFSDEVG
jgi:hypothetical protein